MKTLTAFALGLLVTMNALAQESPKRNTIFFEAGGNGFFYSFNYDRILKDKQDRKWAGRVGLMYLPFLNPENRQMIGIPLELSYLKGRNNNYFELGLGFTTIADIYGYGEPAKFSEFVILSVVRLGYRHQKPEGGFFFKAGLTPLAGVVFNLHSNIEYPVIDSNRGLESFAYPFAGLGFGWTLKK